VTVSFSRTLLHVVSQLHTIWYGDSKQSFIQITCWFYQLNHKTGEGVELQVMSDNYLNLEMYCSINYAQIAELYITDARRYLQMKASKQN
jgi:hypothetical protein